MKINDYHWFSSQGSALSSAEEHFLHTEKLGSDQPIELQHPPGRVTSFSDFCSDFRRKKQGRGKPFVRIAARLYRYGPTGTVYLCFKQNGKNVWRNLQTTDHKRAMAISSFLDYAVSANGHTEITVWPDGIPPVLGLTRPPCQPAAAPQQAQLVQRLEQTVIPPAEVPTVKEAAPSISLNDMVETFKAQAKHLALATRQTMDCHFKVASRHLKFDRDVRDVRLADLRNLKSKLSEDHKPSTVNDILFKGLGALFKIAVEDELIERSPLERLKRSRKGEPDRQQPTWEQSQKIVDGVTESSSETGVIIGFMRHFGVGQAEIKFLIGEHIDLGAGVIHFRRKKTGKAFDVPIYPHAKAFIEDLAKDERFRVGKPVVSWRNPRKALATACALLGLPEFEPRALRRCFIVHCLQEGIDPRLVAKWQGHKDASLIFRVYGRHIDTQHEQRQAQKLGIGTELPAAIPAAEPNKAGDGSSS